MKKLFPFLLALLAIGCGSRKVERQSKSSFEEINTAISEQMNISEIQLDRKELVELIKELTIRDGSVTFHPDGSITAKGSEIQAKETNAKEEIETLISKEQNTNQTVDQHTKKKDTEKNSTKDRKQFNWWGILIPLFILAVFILLLFYFIRKKTKFIRN